MRKKIKLYFGSNIMDTVHYIWTECKRLGYICVSNYDVKKYSFTISFVSSDKSWSDFELLFKHYGGEYVMSLVETLNGEFIKSWHSVCCFLDATKTYEILDKNSEDFRKAFHTLMAK